MARKRNASIRKTKKAYRKDERFFAGASHPIPTWETSGMKKKKKGPKKRQGNPTVYDAAGKIFGKVRRSAAAKVARVIGGTVGKPKASKNPRSGAMIFKTKAQAQAFAKQNRRRGVRISIKKLSKAR